MHRAQREKKAVNFFPPLSDSDRGGLLVDTFSCLARRVRCARLCSCFVGASVRCARLCSFFVEAGALGSCVGQCAQALCFFPKTQLLALSYRPKRRRFSVLSVFNNDLGDFCVPCAVLCPFRAPGVPEQNQRRRRLAHPRDVSVLLLSSGKLIRDRYFLWADVPAPQERVSRSGAQQPMRKKRQVHGLSYPRRIGQRLLF